MPGSNVLSHSCAGDGSSAVFFRACAHDSTPSPSKNTCSCFSTSRMLFFRNMSTPRVRASGLPAQDLSTSRGGRLLMASRGGVPCVVA